MAVSEKAVEFLGNSLNTGRPVPGQSLTNSPEDKYKWESPPEFTNHKEASMYVFETVTVPETTANLLISVINGVSIIDLASIILYSGFLEGKWNPDLLLLLIEPVAYMIMALAEIADIEIIIDNDDETNPDEELSIGQNKLKEIQKRNIVPKLPADVVPA